MDNLPPNNMPEKNKTKIYIFLSTQQVSGAEIVLKEYIQNSKFDFALITPHVEEIIRFFSSEDNVEIISIDTRSIKKHKSKIFSRIFNVCEMIIQAYHLSRVIKNNSVKLLYANNTLAASIAGIAHKFFGIDCIVIAHIHDMISSSPFRPFIKHLCGDFSYISVSMCCKEELEKYCNIKGSKIHVIYNGVNVLPPIPKYNQIFTIGFAGSITERKGLIYLAEVYKSLIDEKEAVLLDIACNFIDEAYWETVKSALSNCKYEIKQYPHEHMTEFYNKIDLLVVPSLRDPLPTTVLEAMNYGVLVIGSKTDGIKEMLSEDNLFAPKDTSSLKQLLKKYIHMTPSEREKTILNNHKTIEIVFNVKTNAEHKDSVLTKIHDSILYGYN